MSPAKCLTLCLLLLLASPVSAQSSRTEDIVSRLRADGYTVTEIRRSLFGRIIVTAHNANTLREVVLNRSSGALLSDREFPRKSSGAQGAPAKTPAARPERVHPQSDRPAKGNPNDNRRDSDRGGGGEGKGGGGRP